MTGLPSLIGGGRGVERAGSEGQDFPLSLSSPHPCRPLIKEALPSLMRGRQGCGEDDE